MGTAVLAVDMGATSVRVCRVDLDDHSPVVEVVHRVAHAPVEAADGSLRWDWRRLLDAVETGLSIGLQAGDVASIGIDGWGVDYGLLDRRGRLLSDPHSYRSNRTAGWRAVCDRLGARRLFDVSGVQLMPINTLFQLAAHDRAELDRASRLLMLPELVVHHLTGTEVGEVTSAGTSGLLDASRRDWCRDVISEVGADPSIFPALIPAATPAGKWRGVPVHLVAGHDTACAVAATPRTTSAGAFVICGTWLLAGRELPDPDLSDTVRGRGFSNEPGPFGGVRLLKNVTGLVLLERLRARWGASLAEMDHLGSAPVVSEEIIDVDDPALLSAPDIEATIRAAARLSRHAGRQRIFGILVHSLASRVSDVLGGLAAITDAGIDEVTVVGGGVRSAPLLRAFRRHIPAVVRTGPPEASALGNALIQGMALGYGRPQR